MNLSTLTRLAALSFLSLLMGGCANVVSDGSRQTRQAKVELWHEFVIVAYPGPPLEEVNAARYREIAEAGIDVIVPGNGTFTAAQNLRAMDLAQAAGLRVIPIDTRIYAFGPAGVRLVDEPTLEAVVADYRPHPAFAGYTIKDEPSADLFPSLRRLRDRLVEKDPDHETFINLFPSYGSPTQLGFADFRTYVRHYLEIVRPRVLSYDFYPLRDEATMDEGWFSDLTIVREESRRANIPFWVFMQSEGIKGYMRVPNRAEVFWQASTALAYGARGICWFTYWTPPPNQGVSPTEGQTPFLGEQHYGGMLDIKGERTPVYDYVREANLFLRHAGRALIGWENAFVARYQEGKLIEGGASPIMTPSGNDANLVIGTFQKNGDQRLLIANSSWEKSARFRLEATSARQGFRRLAATGKNSEKSQDESGLWQLEPGGAVLLEVIPDKLRP